MIDFLEGNKVLVGVLLAALGYGVKYLHDLSLAKRRDGLERINQQLKGLYGPLFCLSYASDRAWKTFRIRHRPETSFFNSEPGPTAEDLAAWRLWMESVFMPLNKQMADVILKNGDLLEGPMPSEFLHLIAHVSVCDTILAKWKSQDFSDHVAYVAFPKNFDKLVRNLYHDLKKRQISLIGGRFARQDSGSKIE